MGSSQAQAGLVKLNTEESILLQKGQTPTMEEPRMYGLDLGFRILFPVQNFCGLKFIERKIGHISAFQIEHIFRLGIHAV